MNDDQGKSLRQQVDEAVIDLRNEVIVQGANAFLLGRRIVLTGIGLAFLGVDQIQAIVQHAVERGEIAEKDIQTRATDMRRNVVDGTTSAISTNVASVLNRIPGISVAYRPLSTGEATTGHDESDAAPKVEH